MMRHLKKSLLLFFVLAYTCIPVSNVAAQDGAKYCEDRGITDLNECTSILRRQGITFVDVIKTEELCSTTVSSQSAGGPVQFDNNSSRIGFDPLSLNYPAFPNENELIQNLKNYILEKYPRSPFAKNLQYVDQIFATSKQPDRNINPLLVIVIARQENGFGQANSSATQNNNYFGITQGPRSYRQFSSVEAGIDYFVEKVSRHVTNPTGPYTGLTNFYEYLSIHQVGLIAYPDEYPDNAPGKNSTPPYLTYDERMDVYTSWDVTRNSHRPGWNSGSNPLLYNPGIYYRNGINTINALTGLNLSTTPDRGSANATFGSCGEITTQSTGTAASYIEDCSVNNGNAAIACTAINQLTGVSYSQALRASATDTSPEYLDCSALTGMAIYRTFGVDLKGLCSLGYLTNSNFEIIDVKDVKPGDFVGKGTICGENDDGIAGHIAIVISYDTIEKKLITVETGSEKYLSGIRGNGEAGTYNVGFAIDGNGNYTWAVRYIGEKTLQPEAL